MTKFSLQGTENLGETSVITVEIRIGFYRKANKYYSEKFWQQNISYSWSGVTRYNLDHIMSYCGVEHENLFGILYSNSIYFVQ